MLNIENSALKSPVDVDYEAFKNCIEIKLEEASDKAESLYGNWNRIHLTKIRWLIQF